jgi:predicted Rossmann fold nucleotide-binding protein DprA/Smf involved in DNA uptake
VVRDRIQSGLSIGVFPIETDIKGGTMHTVKFSQDQGRLLFVPNVFDETISQAYINKFDSNYSKINGIKHLIEKKIATPYTKSSFDIIENMLEERLSFLCPNQISHLEEKQEKNEEKLINSNEPDKILAPVDVIMNVEKNDNEKKEDTSIENIKTENLVTEFKVSDEIKFEKYVIQKITELSKLIANENNIDLNLIYSISSEFVKKQKKYFQPEQKKTKSSKK